MQLEKEKKEKPSYSFFNKINALLWKENTNSSLVSKVTVSNKSAIKEQQLRASKMLDTGLYDIYFEMVKNGYEQTKEQKDKIEDYLYNELFSSINDNFNESYHRQSQQCKTFKKYLNNGYKMTEEMAFKILSKNQFTERLEENIFKNKNIENIEEWQFLEGKIEKTNDSNFRKRDLVFLASSKEILLSIREISNTESFQKNAIDKFLNTFNVKPDKVNMSDFLFCHTVLKFFPKTISTYVEFDTFIDFYQKYKIYKEKSDRNFSRFSEIEGLIKKMIEKNYNNAIKNLLDETKSIYIDEFLEEKTLEQVKTLLNTNDSKNLPGSTTVILDKIKKSFGLLKNNKDNLDNEEKFLIDNLFDKRIPEVLQKYLSMAPEYRETLKNNNNETPLELMNISLQNYLNKIDEIVLRLNIIKMRDLDSTKKYSSAI